VSLNDEIQKLFSNEPSPRELISQQRRLERKISNNLLYFFKIKSCYSNFYIQFCISHA